MPKKTNAAHDYMYECYVTKCPIGGKTFTRLGLFKQNHPECLKFGWAPMPCHNRCFKRKLCKDQIVKKDRETQCDFSGISGEFFADCLKMNEIQRQKFKKWLVELFEEEELSQLIEISARPRERTISDVEENSQIVDKI